VCTRRSRSSAPLRLAWAALALLAAGLLAAFVIRDGRIHAIALAAAAVAWFARPASLASLAVIVPAGPILDAPFLHSPAKVYATEVILLAATACAGVRFALSREDPSRVRIRAPLPAILLGAYAAAGLIALAAGHARLLLSLDGIRGVRVLALAFATPLLFLAAGGERDARARLLRLWTLATVAALAAIAAAGIGEFALGARGPTGRAEPGSFYRESVQVAVHIALFSPVALGLFFSADARSMRLAAGAAWILSLICLILTASRGAMASVIITSAIVAAANARSPAARRAVAIALAVIAIGAAVLIAKPKIAGESFGRKLRATLAGDFISSREAALREEAAAVRANPLFGEGPSATGSSLYLELARRHGIPVAAIAAFRARRGSGLAAGLLGLLIVGFAETSIGARTTPLIATAVAMASLAGRSRVRVEHDPGPSSAACSV